MINFKTSTDITNSVISIVMMMVLCGFPILFGIIMNKNRDKLLLEEMKEKIGSLYLGMRVKTKG